MSKRNKISPLQLEKVRSAIIAFSAAKGQTGTDAIKAFMAENDIWADERLTTTGAEKIKKFIAEYRDTRLDDATAAAARVREALRDLNDALVQAAQTGVDVVLTKGVAAVTASGIVVREETRDEDDDEEDEDDLPRKRAYPSSRPQKERPRYVPRVGIAQMRLRVQL